MFGWLLVSLALFIVQYTTMPTDPMDASRWARALVVVNKLNLLTVAAWLGYWVDRSVFPYGRPDALLRQAGKIDRSSQEHHVLIFAFSMAMLRRAIIIGATVLAVALGV
jgi:hypothetical protein